MSRLRRSFAGSAACVALSLFGSSAARAFCRTNSCDPARGEVCTTDKDGCRQGAKVLYWGTASVPFSVQADGSPKNQIDAATFEQVIASAFHSWSSANCGSGKHPSISALSSGQIATNAVEYIEGQSNANIFMFREEAWLATVPGSALALTTVSYDWHTGRIYDADVEVNGTAGNITNGKPSDGADLPSIVTHEIGHFLGLDHSPKPTATMFITYKPGKSNLRALAADDVAGICAAYPPIAKSTGSNGGAVWVTAPALACSLTSTGGRQNRRWCWAIFAFGSLLGVWRRARRPSRRS